METNRILKSDVLDVIFDDRNKKYGAYELRMNYHKRAKRAMGFTLLFACIAISGPLVATWIPSGTMLPTTLQYIDPVIVTPIEFPPKEPILPKQPEETPNVSVFVPDNLPTEIVPTDEVIDIDDEEETPKVGVAGDFEHKGTVDLPINPILPSGGGSDTGISIVSTIVPEIETTPEVVYGTEDISDLPSFFGGEDEMALFLQKNLVYPKRAVEAGIKGRVVLGFVVNKHGEIDQVEVVKSIGGGCDEEAVRVVKKMPKWKGGKFNGKPVNVYFNLPITFDLQE